MSTPSAQQQSSAEPIAWINGRLVPWSAAALPVWDLGVVAGAAVTEAGRTYGGRFLFADQHVERLLHALRELDFPPASEKHQLLQAAEEIIQQNFQLLPEGSDLGVVMFSTAGGNPTYLGRPSSQPTTVVHTYPLPFSQWRNAFLSGVRLTVSQLRQIPADCFPVSLKVRNRLHWWLADHAAEQQSPGSRALLLNRDGSVAETSTASVCVVRNGHVTTPDGDVLNSLSSRLVERLCQNAGIPFTRCKVNLSELQNAEEIFLTSSPSCLLPVLSVDGHKTQTLPGRGAVFRRLLRDWSLATGVDLEQQMLRSDKSEISR